MKKLFRLLCGVLLFSLFYACSDTEEVNPDMVKVEKSIINNTEKGGELEIKVNSSIPWEVRGISSWCTISPREGSAGENIVNIKVKLNEKAISRKTFFVFVGGAVSDTLEITQEAAEFLYLSTDTLFFEDEGELKKLEVVASGAWTVEGSNEWCSFDKLSGEGNGELQITCLENLGEERSATFNFTMGEYQEKFVVRQKAMEVESILDKERKALVAFYEAAEGLYWVDNEGWLDDDVPVGEWEGIIVDDEGRVTSIVLTSNGLRGSLSGEIAKLERLEKLHINGAVFNDSSIPEELGELTELRELSLKQCGLTGEIPESLGNLKKLVILDLENNLLEGSIPDCIGKLTNLKKISLLLNKLTGTIPSSFSNLVKLEEVRLASNSFEGGISCFWDMPELAYLYLSGNNFSGVISEKVGQLTKLKKINIANNNFTGNLPKELVSSSVISYYDVEQNRLTGEIPIEILEFPDFDWTNKYDWNRICNQQEGFGFTNAPEEPADIVW